MIVQQIVGEALCFPLSAGVFTSAVRERERALNKSREIKAWTLHDTAEIYGIDNWGRGYFKLLETGEVAALLEGPEGPKEVSLYEIVEGLRARGIGMPILLRFEDILKKRVSYINETFRARMAEYHYQGTYQGVYPIKVNQQEQIIKDITSFGARFDHGLEAGSKAELMVALAYVKSNNALIICNGYKDEEFVDLALFGNKIGLNLVIVVERPGELKTILHRSQVCLLYTSPSPRDRTRSRMPSSA